MGGLPFPTPGDLPDLGIEPVSLASPVVILSKGRKWIFFKIVWHTHSSGSRDLFLCLRKFPFSLNFHFLVIGLYLKLGFLETDFEMEICVKGVYREMHVGKGTYTESDTTEAT